MLNGCGYNRGHPIFKLENHKGKPQNPVTLILIINQMNRTKQFAVETFLNGTAQKVANFLTSPELLTSF